MKTKAAVLVETGRPLEIDDLEIPPLAPGQVLVEIAFSGVCHTQLLESRGWRGHDPFLPHCLGHEGSGRVLEIGPGVSKCATGDTVVLSWIKGSGANVPKAEYQAARGVVQSGGVATFAERAVVSENRITPIAEDFPMDWAAMLGCATPTGAGAVFHTAGVRPGESVAVFGAGGVGLCAVAAAAVSGAVPLIAVDLSDDRLDAAKLLGATHTLNAGSEDIAAQVAAIAEGGLDYAIEATGSTAVMQQALALVRGQGGACVIAGNAHHGRMLEINPSQLNQGKRLLGTWGGDNQPDRDFPRYAKLVREQRINVAPLLSKPYALENINQALDDLEARRVIRPLVACAS